MISFDDFMVGGAENGDTVLLRSPSLNIFLRNINIGLEILTPKRGGIYLIIKRGSTIVLIQAVLRKIFF